jgi:general secretion pathway protein G
MVMRKQRERTRGERGFTIIEMIIVIFMIMILMAIAIPRYQVAVLRAREAALRQDLYHLRNAIDAYTNDKQKAPQALDDLVSAGYFRELPKDPFTNSNQTWQPIMEDVLTAIDQQEPGITDVKSGAQGNDSEGKAYSEY